MGGSKHCVFLKANIIHDENMQDAQSSRMGRKKTTKVPHIYGTPPHQKTQPKTKQASNNLMSIRVFVSE